MPKPLQPGEVEDPASAPGHDQVARSVREGSHAVPVQGFPEELADSLELETAPPVDELEELEEPEELAWVALPPPPVLLMVRTPTSPITQPMALAVVPKPMRNTARRTG
jgi:hypothetical protein